MDIALPYGRDELHIELPDARVKAVLRSGVEDYDPGCTEEQLIEDALLHPIGSEPLHRLAAGKKRIVLIASDHTRPVPSRLIIPPMLREIRRGNPAADITILVATGCHRGTTQEELRQKFGDRIAAEEKIVVHNCDDPEQAYLGILPGGGECFVDSMVRDADLLVSEGFIEPHFFAGYSGGRKSILPGIASRRTVLANHCSEFISSPFARTGILEQNSIHRDMLWAADQAKLAFILNVVLNASKRVICAVAGDFRAAHEAGCRFIADLCTVRAVPADIVMTTNGGYPLDQNIYQAVKGMTAAEACVNPGGVIIMAAKSNDGHGGESFLRLLSEDRDIRRILKDIQKRSRDETIPDQWQAQIFIRILLRASVIYISDADDALVERLHMIPAHSPEEALRKADRLLGRRNAGITVIPDGVSVIVNG